jgi:hypothetical protein
VLPGYALCYQCEQARRVAGGALADAVVPVAYAVKGGDLARDLWRYKSGASSTADTGAASAASPAADRIQGMLTAFLGEYGDLVWRAAGMPDGPNALAVVPSGQGREGDHPLLAIAEQATALSLRQLSPSRPPASQPPLKRLPVIPLSVRPGIAAHGRYVSTGWLRVDGRVTGLDVLLVEDSWVSGASAQSAAAALKLAGAARVATVVIGRHIDPADPRSGDLIRALSA